MTLVISSPSISTIGFFILIFSKIFTSCKNSIKTTLIKLILKNKCRYRVYLYVSLVFYYFLLLKISLTFPFINFPSPSRTVSYSIQVLGCYIPKKFLYHFLLKFQESHLYKVCENQLAPQNFFSFLRFISLFCGISFSNHLY